MMGKKEKKVAVAVAVAMSGGVDSGVAAALLVKAGYSVAGFYLHLWQEAVPNGHAGKESDFENKCCNTESLEAARKTAHQLEIPFYTLDLAALFKKKVVDYFLREYGRGLTPNPCVRCNRFIKFGKLLAYIRELDYDYLATGHYARLRLEVKNSKFKIYHLLQGVDKQKDQSYFLYNLTQEQLAHILFPVGDYLKREIRAMAKQWQLPVAERPESQEICFFPESDYRPFLKRQLREKIIPGEVVDTQGRVIGRHQGLPLYTIGQRHGFEIKAKGKRQKAKLIPPFYVVGKKVKENQLIVGFGKEAEKREFVVGEVNWVLGQEPQGEIQVWVRVRHQGELIRAKVQKHQKERTADRRVKVILAEPERGVAPGQAAVFYRKFRINTFEVLGGGIIRVEETSH